jgi:hypothetical protein
MAHDLYGESYVSNWDYARKIVTLGMKLPFYKVSSFLTPNGCSIDFFSENFGGLQPAPNEVATAGLYAIYEKTPDKIECLYVGESRSSMRDRVYRFVKELHGVSRYDETHPGGRKARKACVDPGDIYVKFFPRSSFPKIDDLRIEYGTLDETCAILLKSRFNKRKKA